MGRHAIETPNRVIENPATRRWLYRIVEAALGLAGGYGLVEVAMGDLWLGVAAALLGVGGSTALEIAWQNTPRDD